MTTTNSIAQLSDDALLCETTQAAADERHATARLISLLMEVDRRRLYLGRGYSSMFVFCLRALHMSEHAAYGRIATARLSRRFPATLTMLSAGDLTLSSIRVLAPHLTEENADALLDAASRKSTREVERLVATLYPAPDIPPMIRALPDQQPQPAMAARGGSELHPVIPDAYRMPSADGEPRLSERGATYGGSADFATNKGSTAGIDPSPSIAQHRPLRAAVAPIAPKKYLLRLTISQETVDKLERARSLLRHVVPDGDPAILVDRALALLVQDAERKQFAVNEPDRPKPPVRSSGPRGRYIPAAVRRAAWKRDGAQCAFVGTEGRCQERSWLQLHHVVPYAAGGLPTVDNIQLRCRAHNLYDAVRDFGEATVRTLERSLSGLAAPMRFLTAKWTWLVFQR